MTAPLLGAADPPPDESICMVIRAAVAEHNERLDAQLDDIAQRIRELKYEM